MIICFENFLCFNVLWTIFEVIHLWVSGNPDSATFKNI